MTTEAEARAHLERLVAATTPPTLDSNEISALLAAYALTDNAGATYAGDVAWSASMALAVGDRVVPSLRTGKVYEVTASDGTAGTEEPSWPDSGSVTADGVTYERAVDDPAAWQPSYALAAAAAEGWRVKAGLVSDRFRFADEGDSYDRQQIFEHCVRMAEMYEKKAAAGELVVGAPIGNNGASMLSLDPTDRRVELDDQRLIVLRQRSSSGDVLRVN